PTGGASKLFLATDAPAGAQSGIAFTPQPAVQLQDANGNSVSQQGVVVTATIATGPGGATLAGATATTSTSGLATFAGLTLSGTSWNYTLQMSAGVLSPTTTQAISLGAGTASSLALATPASVTAQSGVAFAQQPAIQVRDAAGNPVNQAGVVVTADRKSGVEGKGGNLSGTTLGNGVARCPNREMSGTAGARTVCLRA